MNTPKTKPLFRLIAMTCCLLSYGGLQAAAPVEWATEPIESNTYTAAKRYIQWAELWPVGREVISTCKYNLGGKFYIKLEENDPRWTMTALIKKLKHYGFEKSVKSLTLLVGGAQEADIITLANTKRTGFWQMLYYKDHGKVNMSLDAEMYDTVFGRTAGEFFDVNEITEKARADYVKKGHWLITAKLSQILGGEVAKNIRKRKKEIEETRKQWFAPLFPDNTTDVTADTYTLPLDNGRFNSEVLKTWLPDNLDPAIANKAKNIGIDFVNEFDNRLVYLIQSPSSDPKSTRASLIEGYSSYLGPDGEKNQEEAEKIKRKDAQEDPFSVYDEASLKRWSEQLNKRRVRYNETMRWIVRKEKELREKGEFSLTKLLKSLYNSQEKCIDWPDKEYMRHWTGEDYFLEMHHGHLLPHETISLWGNDVNIVGNPVEYSPNVRGRGVGSYWTIPASVFARFRHSDFSHYAFFGEIVVKRVSDDTKTNSYVLKIVESNESGTKQTTLRFASTEPGYASFNMLWDETKRQKSTTESQEEEKPKPKPLYLYINRDTGTLKECILPLVASVGNNGNLKAGNALPGGIRITPNSRVRLVLDISNIVQSEENEKILKEKIKTTNPFPRGKDTF